MLIIIILIHHQYSYLQAVLREKDVELSTLRSHIEHNEESMARAYQEKERRWQRELGQVLERARQSENNEARTISEMQRVREDLQRLQLHVNQLESEKYGLQKTVDIIKTQFSSKHFFQCKTVENQLFQERAMRQCKRCGEQITNGYDTGENVSWENDKVKT